MMVADLKQLLLDLQNSNLLSKRTAQQLLVTLLK